MTANTNSQDPSPIHSCPDCKKPLRRIEGKMGPFWGCTGFPSCKTSFNDIDGKPTEEINEGYRCPICTRKLIKSENGYWFCSGYSKGCKTTIDDEDGTPKASYRCGECGSLLTQRSGKNGVFWGCGDYPVCSKTYNDINGRPDL